MKHLDEPVTIHDFGGQPFASVTKGEITSSGNPCFLIPIKDCPHDIVVRNESFIQKSIDGTTCIPFHRSYVKPQRPSVSIAIGTWERVWFDTMEPWLPN